MTKPLTLGLFLVVSTVAIGSLPRAQSVAPVPPELFDRVGGGGSIAVTVGLDTAAPPVRSVDGPRSLLARQATLRASLDPVIAFLESQGIAVTQRFENFPYFSTRVDARGLALLAAMPEVTSVREPVFTYSQLALSVPLIRAPDTWAAGSDGTGWFVAILDSGVAKAHPFLQNAVAQEGCGSGGVLTPASPDVNVEGLTLCPQPASNGANYWWGVNTGVPCTGYPVCDHGTHVAGIAVGGTGNPGGVSGVAPAARLLSVQVFRVGTTPAMCGGGPAGCTFVHTDSMLWAFDQVFTRHFLALNDRVAAINMSLGTRTAFTSQAQCDGLFPAVTEAIADLRDVGGNQDIGIATIVASGNDGLGHNGSLNGVSWPACVSQAVSVGSTTKSDLISDFTNRAPFLSLLAPGSNIISSVPSGPDTAKSGTSMAAPHVAGAWAVLKQAKPAATVTEILDALRTSGVPITDPFAIPAQSYPRIDLKAARDRLLNIGPAAPGVPGQPTATVNGNAVTITWAAPVAGGVPTHYLIVAGTTPAGSDLGTHNVGATRQIATVLGNGTYYLRVIAVNAAGQSAPSAEGSFTIGGAGAPGAPTTPLAVISGNVVTLTWTAGSGPAPTAFLIVAGTSSGASDLGTFDVGAQTSIAAALGAGTYFVRLVAVNGAGQSAPSGEVSFTIGGGGGGVPGMPVLAHPIVAGTTVTLDWTPAPAGGVPAGYEIEAVVQATGQVVIVPVGPQTTLTIPGVPPGNYILRIRATSGAGASAWSLPRQLVVGIVLQTGDLQITVTWTTLAAMDLHVIEPDGTHVYWDNPDGPTAHHELDDQDGFGPENIYVLPGQAATGSYQVYVVQWDTSVVTTSTIGVRIKPGTPDERYALITRQTPGPDIDLGYNVAEVNVGTGAIVETFGTRAADRRSAGARRTAQRRMAP